MTDAVQRVQAGSPDATLLSAPPELPDNAEILYLSVGNATLFKVTADDHPDYQWGKHFLRLRSGPEGGDYEVNLPQGGGLL